MLRRDAKSCYPFLHRPRKIFQPFGVPLLSGLFWMVRTFKVKNVPTENFLLFQKKQNLTQVEFENIKNY